MNKQTKILLKQAAYYIKKAEFEKQGGGGILGLFKNLFKSSKNGKSLERIPSTNRAAKTLDNLSEAERFVQSPKLSITGNPVLTDAAQDRVIQNMLRDPNYRYPDFYRPQHDWIVHSRTPYYIPERPVLPKESDFSGPLAETAYKYNLDKYNAFKAGYNPFLKAYNETHAPGVTQLGLGGLGLRYYRRGAQPDPLTQNLLDRMNDSYKRHNASSKFHLTPDDIHDYRWNWIEKPELEREFREMWQKTNDEILKPGMDKIYEDLRETQKKYGIDPTDPKYAD